MSDKQVLDPLSTDRLQTDLKGRSVRGGAMTLTSQGAQFVVSSVMTVVLARLLTPADFGLVAMVTAVTGLAQAFADVGLSEATIQRENITHDQVSALFWINLAVGIGLTLVTIALGPVLARFDRQRQLPHIAFWLSFTFLICGLRVQPDAILKRQMRFKALAIRDIFANAMGVAAAIIMALRGAGYWALVAYPLASNLIQMAASWKLVDWKPGFPSRNAKVGSLVAFGGNVAVSYFMFTVNRSVDKVLVGWYWGAGPLGFYGRACNLLMYPVRQLNAPMASVGIPTFSRLQADPQRFARYYLRSVNLLMWVCAPLFAYLFVAAGPVIALVLGRQWGNAAPVFRMLAISCVTQLLLESTVWLFVSRGQSTGLRKLLLSISPVIMASFAIGLPFGITGVAISYSVAMLALMPWILKFAFRGTELTLWGISHALKYPVSLGLLGALLGELALRAIAPGGAIAQLFVIALGFGVVLSLSAAVPAVRAEIVALKELAREFRFAGQAA